MQIDVFLAVLAAALMHAGWNAIIKMRLDRLSAMTLMSFLMGALASLTLPFIAPPGAESWKWILTGSALHTGYKLFLVRAYAAGDLVQIYPLARGAAPLITAVAGLFILGEDLSAMAMFSIAVLSIGIALMAFRGGGGVSRLSGSAMFYALITSIFIASYSLNDGIGARTASSPFSYGAWLFTIDGFAMAAIALPALPRGAVAAMRHEWRGGLAAAALSLGAYVIVLWAMTRAPVAAVAALRESSILFALLISVIVLKERLTPWRVGAALTILAGVAGLRLG